MEENKTYYIPFFIPVIALIVIAFGLMIYFQKKVPLSAGPSGSGFSLTGTPAVSGAKTEEPLVLKWVTYQNAKYYFSLEVPEGWKQQDYAAFYTNGATVIAFSPNDLPCGTCSYFQDGYFSVRIYNEKTSPELYSRFAEIKKALGKVKEVIPVTIAGHTGALYENTISVEYNGWVYEFVLDKDKGNASIGESKIFQRVANSLQFTDLRFNPLK